MSRGDLVSKLLEIRSNWTLEDYRESYADEWDEMPTTVKECKETMEEYIYHTYDLDYLKEVIETEST